MNLISKLAVALGAIISLSGCVGLSQEGEGMARAVGGLAGQVIGGAIEQGASSAGCAISAYGNGAIQRKLTGSQAVGAIVSSREQQACVNREQYYRENERQYQISRARTYQGVIDGTTQSIYQQAMQEQFQGLPRTTYQSEVTNNNGQVSRSETRTVRASSFGHGPQNVGLTSRAQVGQPADLSTCSGRGGFWQDSVERPGHLEVGCARLQR